MKVNFNEMLHNVLLSLCHICMFSEVIWEGFLRCSGKLSYIAKGGPEILVLA